MHVQRWLLITTRTCRMVTLHFQAIFFPESRIKIDILTRDRFFLLTTPIHFDFDALDQIILNGSDF